MLTTSDPASSSFATQQRRVGLMFRLGFALSGSFLVVMLVARGVMGHLGDELRSPSRWMHVAATAWLALVWWFARRRLMRTTGRVVALDAIGTLGAVALLDANALLLPARTVGTFNVILTCGLVLVLRAVIVPSPWTRTLAVSAAASLLSVGLLVASTVAGWPPVLDDPSWPPAYQMISAAVWLSALTASATLASRIVFGLRREVRNARRIGQYVLHEKIGEGGMGVVFRATHALLRRDTALKLLPPSKIDAATAARFEKEVTLTAKLTHPNTIAVFDYGSTPDGSFYYVMEYLDGLTLGELVELTGPLPPRRVVHLVAQICASLTEAHELGLVHRDIKPANVVVTCRAGIADHVKVLDFGLVKDVARKDGLSTAGQLLGTPLTMSPEAITSPASVGPAADLYAVGVVAYELLTGQNVFDGATAVEVCAHHLYDAPVSPSARLGEPIDRDLEAIVLEALAKKPEERPASARIMRERLLACPVGTWTEDEAMAWWKDVGAEALARRQASSSRSTLERSPTLPILTRGRRASGPPARLRRDGARVRPLPRGDGGASADRS